METTSTREPDAAALAAGRLFDAIVLEVWEDALRFAFDLEHAAERCGRRACRDAGACRVRWSEGRPVDCRGGFSGEAIMTAVAVAAFGGHMIMRCLPPPAIARSAGGRRDVGA